jgi:hypothetical protein
MSMFDAERRRLYRTSLMTLLMLTFLLTANQSLVAGTPELAIVSFPERSARSAGFKLSLTCENFRLFGDVPVGVQIEPDGGKFLTERTITIQITPTPRTSQPPGMDAAYEIPITLPEGSGPLSKTYYLPKWTVGGSFDVAIREDRRVLDGYQGRIAGLSMYAAQAESTWWESAKERFSWIVDTAEPAPDGRTFFATVAPELLNLGEIESSPPNFDFAAPWRTFNAVPLDQLPRDWRGFDAADVWIIQANALKKLMEQPGAQASALRSYLRCGGTLWVLGDAKRSDLTQWFQLVDANLQLNESLLNDAVNLASTAFDYDSYRASSFQPSASSRGYLRELASGSGRPYSVNSFATNQVSSEARFESNLAWFRVQELDGTQEIDTSHFAAYPLGLGRIVVCNRANVVPGSPQQWRAMMNLTDSEMSETLRRGVDPSFGDRRFWDWIIPNVAQPPVYTFIGLLCTFVIVVGPLAYRKFTKIGRGYLMMFVAPLLALITTLVMFVYGLVADGLSTSTRVREVTWIPDGSGDAARYCRATYFAGVRPAEGMSFPKNAVITPYQLPSVGSWFEASQQEHSTIGTMRLSDQETRLDSGFLPSRQQKQFITYFPVEKVGRLKLEATGNPDTMNLTSEMSMNLRSGVVRSIDGRYFAFSEISPKQTLEVIALEKTDASERLSELYAVQRPLPPAAVSSSRRMGDVLIDMVQSLGARSGPRQVIGNRNTTGESAVEGWLRMSLQIESQLPSGTFIALSDISPDCIAVDGAELIESVHYVIGVIP